MVPTIDRREVQIGIFSEDVGHPLDHIPRHLRVGVPRGVVVEEGVAVQIGFFEGAGKFGKYRLNNMRGLL